MGEVNMPQDIPLTGRHEHFAVEGNTGYFCSGCGIRLGEYLGIAL